MRTCKKCAKSRFTALMTDAKCGHETTRGGMTYCVGCATMKNACEACGTPLAPSAPADKNDDPPPHTD